LRTILVVNDDGVNSPGIQAAAEAVKTLGRTVVVAPAVQQSGVGRSISLFSPVTMAEEKIDDLEAYSVSGTPVDAVIVGTYGVLKSPPDLIVSGINIGENLSCEATTSGTVGAALEGASQGIPSIAVSLHVSEKIKFGGQLPGLDFTVSKELLKKLAKHVLERGLPDGVDVLNVNVPVVDDIPPVAITRLARRMYTTRVKERYDPRGRKYYWIDGDPIYEAEEGTDVHAVRVKRCASITPLTLDFTVREVLEGIEIIKDIFL
jgi:5'-nucleotidase